MPSCLDFLILVFQIKNIDTPIDRYRYTDGALNAHHFSVICSLIENRNKSIKLLKHSSNGYLNWHRFKMRIMCSLNNDSTYHMYPIKNKRDYTK